MVKKAGVVILKKPKWAYPKVFVTLNRREKSIDMSIEDFAVALKTEIGIRITKKQLGKAIDKILAEMRESVVLPMEK